MLISPPLLDWYDRAARVLPWRIPPGSPTRADPYRVWLSEVMLQQTTVAAVQGYFHRFTTRWPDVGALAAAPDVEVMAEWAGLGYYARARNLLACARAVVQAGGAFPQTEAALRALPGIGPYTAAAIAAIAFGQPAVVVDGNVERVLARLFAVDVPLPSARPALWQHAAAQTPQTRPGDHAQALMDLGATICTPRNPSCLICPLNTLCASHARGDAASRPRKAPKAEKPTRQGQIWVAQTPQGGALVELRPARGLLGGMPGFPTGGWDGTPDPGPPFPAPWQAAGAVRHTFTHFHLILTVQTALLPPGLNPERGQIAADFDPATLPTLMRKAWEKARQQRG